MLSYVFVENPQWANNFAFFVLISSWVSVAFDLEFPTMLRVVSQLVMVMVMNGTDDVLPSKSESVTYNMLNTPIRSGYDFYYETHISMSFFIFSISWEMLRVYCLIAVSLKWH